MREQRLLRGSVTRCRPSLSQFYILGSVPKKFCSLPSWALGAAGVQRLGTAAAGGCNERR
jgi:hypothetical protein